MLTLLTNASRNPMRPRLRTLRRITIPRRTILPAAVPIVPVRIMAAVVIVAMIAAATAAVGDAVADAIVVEARRAAPADAICLPRNMLRHRAASPADMTIAADSHAVTTLAVRKLHAARRPPNPTSPRRRSFFQANRWQNTALSLPLRLRRFRPLSTKPA